MFFGNNLFCWSTLECLFFINKLQFQPYSSLQCHMMVLIIVFAALYENLLRIKSSLRLNTV